MKDVNPNSYSVKVHHIYSSLGAGKFCMHLFINKLHKMICSMGKEMFEQGLPGWRKWILEQSLYLLCHIEADVSKHFSFHFKRIH